MILTKQLLEARLLKAIQERDELCARMNARVGEINTLTHLLEVLELPEPAAALPPGRDNKPASQPGRTNA